MSLLQLFSRTPQKKPSLYKLPPEILQQIAQVLPTPSAALFALTNKYLFHVVGRQYFRLEKTDWMVFLSTLQRDVEHWVLCYYCQIFHYVPPGRGLFFGTLASPRCADRYLRTRVKCLNTPGLTFIDVQRMLNEHRYGFSQGMEMRLSNTARFQAEPRRGFADEFKVIDDELFLKRDMVLGYRYGDSSSWDRALADIPCVCRHVNLNYGNTKPLKAPSNANDEELCSWLRCRVCGAEIRSQHTKLGDTSQCEIRLTSWHAFGKCQSPFEEQWTRTTLIEKTSSEEPIFPNQAVVHARYEKAPPAQEPSNWYYFLGHLLGVPGNGRYRPGWGLLLPYLEVGLEVCP
ncbi:hypothetical protein DTO166G4_4672 [Paecilomyces variotii]|nr:hypothetical protein DTO166G4_4672 [Paecilomyces variotii]KAJ9238181.1 hypothetical protein DTO166G5_3083 [Paecilomyces variotii]